MPAVIAAAVAYSQYTKIVFTVDVSHSSNVNKERREEKLNYSKYIYYLELLFLLLFAPVSADLIGTSQTEFRTGDFIFFPYILFSFR